MVSLGEKGNTAVQMFKVLGFDSPAKLDAVTPVPHQQAHKPQMPCGVKGQHELPMVQQTQIEISCSANTWTKIEDQIHSSFNKLMSELKKPGAPYVLSLANHLYGEQSYQFVEVRLTGAGLEEVDFKKKSDAVRANSNKWVEKNTQEKIKHLLPQGSINDLTKLVLVNAIYFKGNWEKKFPKEASRDGQFKPNKVMKMMYQESKFPLAFIPEMNSQVVELPYVGKNLSMLIILPNEIQDETTGLQKLEKALTYKKLMEWTKPNKMLLEQVEVSLPRFKMEESYDMKSLLIKGTEAAGATGVVIAGFSMQLPLKTFIADHPFLFFIRHNPSNSILFYGCFCSP
uniref:Serpin B6 n=1 Tax=Cyprinus carpio TaxID=7962 RepID=A0A8C1Q1A2_CYPCA